MRKTIIILATIIILLFAVGSFLSPALSPTPTLGGMTNYDGLTITPVDSSDGLKVGSSGSTITKIISGTCNLTGGAIAATSTGIGNCAVTGVVVGDRVFASLATTSPIGAVAYAQASTTAGNISVGVLNLSGSASSISAFGTTTSYLIIR